MRITCQIVREIDDNILELECDIPNLDTIKKKRAPSAYNLFIGKCMKDGKDMKTCALEYKKEKREF